ncbi:hypothetical protein [Microbacterium sp.]|uniref:hypothetical protein n=1 Tax=Microbacterium sp. TaxID=51671 RepID=UPI003A8B3666
MEDEMTQVLTPTVLRRLAPPDCPYRALLVADDPPRLWVDVAEFGSSPAWRADGEGHVLAPVDLARTREGQAVVLPHCPSRLETVVGSIDTAGAAATAAVSMLRGAAEADRLGADAGSWWVTAEGRPVLALTGTLPWRPMTGELLETLARAVPVLRTELTRAQETLADAGRLRREAAAREDELFAVADPEHLPVAGGVDAPRRTRRAPVAPYRDREQTSMLARWASAIMDREVLDRARSLVPRRRAKRPAVRRPREREGRRHAPVLVGLAVAIMVIAVGVFWPEGSEAGGAPASDAIRSDPAAEASVSAPEPEPESLAEVGRALVARLAECQQQCAVWEGGSGTAPAGAAGVAEATVTLVEEYGGVAVFRAEAEGEHSQIVVAVHADGTWRVREVYDLTNPPA